MLKKTMLFCILLFLLTQTMVLAQGRMVFTNRIPADYFVTTGFGDTELGAGQDPWETGSYDLALQMAKIENYNIVTYTSVLPPEAKEKKYDDVKHLYHHGAVMETIMAAVNGKKGDQLCAGVGRIQVRRISDKKHIGGFAAEFSSNNATETEARQALHASLMGIFQRRYSPSEYEFFGEKFNIISRKVTKKYGTALAAICFVTYIFPPVK